MKTDGNWILPYFSDRIVQLNETTFDRMSCFFRDSISDHGACNRPIEPIIRPCPHFNIELCAVKRLREFLHVIELSNSINIGVLA